MLKTEDDAVVSILKLSFKRLYTVLTFLEKHAADIRGKTHFEERMDEEPGYIIRVGGDEYNGKETVFGNLYGIILNVI